MPTSIRLRPELDARLKALSALTGRSKAFYIHQALEDRIEDLEDIYIAEQRILDGDADKAILFQEVVKKLGLDTEDLSDISLEDCD